ncbi:unnamed protein product [Fusarium venenatum]|uniref:Uncharacterized protein n=1 Tax=Fusarium venenatum TaxID=56646 RepID=A0A2L2TQE0_9HYPO|nr:uncharacterized protein FVRRES_08208 [Fusarium venenatum]CEI68131.1 unnamed protein product [Fusarium venenatum]
MGLSALYLQIADRKEDAYLYVSIFSEPTARSANLTPSRLARPPDCRWVFVYTSLDLPEVTHARKQCIITGFGGRSTCRNGISLLVVRLTAAVGFPMAVSEASITAAHPAYQIGHPSSTAIAVNVKLAQITGRITTTIYSQNIDPEDVFIKEVQDILHSLNKIKNEMPPEISGGSHPTKLLLSDAPLPSSQQSSARTITSLHLTVNQQNIIYAVRPILLHMPRSSFSGGSNLYTSMSHTLRRLADTCVETPHKSLVILHGLRKQDIIGAYLYPFQRASGSVPMAPGEAQGQRLSARIMTDNNAFEIQDAVMASTEDLGDIVLEGEDDLYWIYHNPSLSLTDVEQTDWETLDNHIVYCMLIQRSEKRISITASRPCLILK